MVLRAGQACEYVRTAVHEPGGPTWLRRDSDDAVEALAALDLFRRDDEAELLLQRAGEGTADGVRLPAGGDDNLVDGGAPRSLQHGDERRLLGALPRLAPQRRCVTLGAALGRRRVLKDSAEAGESVWPAPGRRWLLVARAKGSILGIGIWSFVSLLALKCRSRKRHSTWTRARNPLRFSRSLHQACNSLAESPRRATVQVGSKAVEDTGCAGRHSR